VIQVPHDPKEREEKKMYLFCAFSIAAMVMVMAIIDMKITK
jgi:hypothetical protein